MFTYVKKIELSKNFHMITLGNRVTMWFSYETIVAIRIDDRQFVSENEWSNTTGKHLNAIEPNKKNRVSHKVILTVAKRVFSSTFDKHVEKMAKGIDFYIKD